MAPAEATLAETAVVDHGTQAGTLQPDDAHGAEHVVPVAFGFVGPAAWVSLAMLVFIGILLWKGVPKLIAGGLDGKIAAIRAQLDEAKALRAEAEALRAEYATKIANAEKDAAAMITHAQGEAEAIVTKAQADATAMIGRREKMAQDKIGAAERGAVESLRAQAAAAAAEAARGLIAGRHGADADRKLVDSAIAGL
jgi:F-type H+-transporting ATPase subunit b